MVFDVFRIHVMPSDETRMTPLLPTVTNWVSSHCTSASAVVTPELLVVHAGPGGEGRGGLEGCLHLSRPGGIAFPAGQGPGEREKENEERGESQGTQSGASTITVSPTQVQQNVNGYNCTKYVVTRGSEESTVWATKDIPEYSSMKSDLQKLASRLGDIPAARGILQVAERIDGFPVQREHDGVTEKITDVQRQSIPAQVFELPQGYRQTKGGPRQGPVHDPDKVQ